MMKTIAIETQGLSHHFSRQEQVLDSINLQVPEGSIFGFLGPNGAGKTTTLRLLLGLLRLQEGSIRIFGQSLETHRNTILHSIGSMIESPSLYAHLSARDNLRIWQKLYACPAHRIDEVLSITGLRDTGHKKAGRFSLGMKQRLGIAVSLLHQPRLLILDEPTNGLDPSGIQEIRDLIRDLNRQSGVTILISSHILPEIEKIATDLGIIHRGRLLYQGTLQGLAQTQPLSCEVMLHTTDNMRALELLNRFAARVDPDQEGIRVCLDSREDTPAIARILTQESIGIYCLVPEQADLESIFLSLIQS